MNQRKLTLHSISPADDDGSDQFIDIDRLIGILFRRARVIAAFAGGFLALAALYLLLATPIYTSLTQILLDDDLAKYAEEAQPVPGAQQIDNHIASAVQILKSNALALRVVDAEKLADNDTILNPPQSPVALVKSGLKSIVTALSPGRPPISEDAALNNRRQKAAALLQQAVDVQRVARSSVVEVSFKSSDPQLAARITRAYAQAYLTDQLNANFDATEQASVWLQERLADLRQRSQAAAMEVETFKAKNGLTSTRGELMSEQQLSDLNSQLIIAQADTASAEARYNQYRSIIEQGPDAAINNATVLSNQGGNTVIQDLKTRYIAVDKREQEVTANFGKDHPQAVALRAERQDISRQIFEQLQQLTASYNNELKVAQSREASLRNSIDGVVGRNSEANQSLVRLNDLEQKATALKTLYESYLGRYEAAAQQRSFPIAKARVISEAGVPTAPSSPKKTMTVGLALVLGLMAGCGFAAFQEFRERYFRVEADVKSVLGLKFLGYLPMIGLRRNDRRMPWSAKKPAPGAPSGTLSDTGPGSGDGDAAFDRMMRIVIEAPRSAFAETLRNAKLAADVMLQGRQDRVIGVISSLPGEGKSTTAANFAALLASSGKRTLLIDADLRNPGLTRMLKTPPQVGLVEAVIGETPWASAVKVDSRTRLAILPAIANDHLMHTSELLASPGMKSLMENARKMFDYVVVDLAPLGPVVDAKAFESQVDAFLFVAEWGVTPRSVARDVLHAEPQINSKILGVILNKTDMGELKKYSNFGGTEHYREKYASYYVESETPREKAPAPVS